MVVKTDTIATENIKDLADARMWIEGVRPHFIGMVGSILIFKVQSRTRKKEHQVQFDAVRAEFRCSCEWEMYELERKAKDNEHEIRPCHHIQVLRDSIDWS